MQNKIEGFRLSPQQRYVWRLSQDSQSYRAQCVILLEGNLEVEVLEQAIRYEGSTLSDGTYRNALNQEGGYQNQHRVYDRQGQLCSSCCRQQIVRIVQAQRSTFYCPKCQGRGQRADTNPKR